MDLKEALEDGAPLVHSDVPNNLAAHFIQMSGDPDAAFGRAEHVTRIEVQVDRSTAAPMECRAVAARWDAVSGELTVWDGTQAPISVRGGLASISSISTKTKFGSSLRMSAAASVRRFCCFIRTNCSCRWRPCSWDVRLNISRIGARTSSAPRRSARKSTRSSLRRSRLARSSGFATAFCTIPARSFLTASPSPR